MGVLIRPDYIDRRQQEGNYAAWRDSPIGAGGSYEDYQRWIASIGPTGAAPQPGQQPTPIAPPPSIPSPGSPGAGPPAFTPPQVQMPALLQNPQPQGLGGMPLIRDRMMATTMSPFASPNWGIQQVNPMYLTQQMPLAGGATPADAMRSTMPAMGIGGTGASQLPIGLGGMRIPRRPVIGMGTV